MSGARAWSVPLGLAAAVELAGCFTAPHPVATSPASVPVPVTPPTGTLPPSVPDIVPRVEPLSRYGNPPFYEVYGKRYYVLSSSVGYIERGVASWYGPGFHQVRTSTGETYDMYAMTAAHKTLPLPAYVRVINLENGRSVVVRVNDRGPFVGNRIIDLSYTAAARLDMLRNGTAMVEVRALDPRAPLPHPGAPVVAAATPIIAAGTSAATASTPIVAAGTSAATASTPIVAAGTSAATASTPIVAAGMSAATTSTPIVAVAAPGATATASPRSVQAGAAKSPTAMQTPIAAQAPTSAPAPITPTPTSTSASASTSTSASIAPTTTGTVSVPGAAGASPGSLPTAATHPALFVQAGAFADPANAEHLVAKLRGRGYGTIFVRDDIIAGRKMYRVRIGPVPNVPEFDRIVAALESVGVHDAHLALD